MSEVKRRIDLKRSVRVKGDVYEAKIYIVPDELDEGLANWFIEKGMAEEIDVEVIELGEGPKAPGMGSPIEPNRAKKILALDKFKELVGNDYVELFAPAGHGKSRLLAYIAIEAMKAGKKVLYLDCEHSLPKRIEDQLGKFYQQLDFMNLEGIINTIAAIPKGYDLVCYDSMGFPILIKFIQLNLRERGDAIAKTILLRGHLKQYAERNNALTLATNQPVSELVGMDYTNKTEREQAIKYRDPVGGKSIHIAKAVIRMDIASQTSTESVFELRAFECQDLPFDKLIATFTINEQGERLEWKI